MPTPTLTKPPAGVHGHPLWDSWHELDSFGYRQDEYLVSGTARSLSGTTAPYTTRIIVFRPKAQQDFNGAVMLDWVNVTALFESAVDTLEGRETLLREGFAFVHVSAQQLGLCCSLIHDPDLLILDELGYVPASKAGAELLFDVIATAYERNSLIVTTNLPFENWTEVLGSERLTGAALDRLTHRCHILETKGESYRLQDAKRRRRRTA